MNLDQVYRVLQLALPDIKVSYSKFEENSQPYYYLFYGFESLKDAYSKIQKFAPFLISDENNENITIFFGKDAEFGSLRTDKSIGNSIIYSVNDLAGTVNKFTSYIYPFISHDASENSISVKFPLIKDLGEFEKCINELRHALNVPVYALDGRVEIEKVDAGSILIDLVILGTAAIPIIKVIAELIHSAIGTKNQYHQGQILSEHARTIGLKNDMLEIFLKQAKDHYEQSKEAQAKRILDEYVPDKSDPENVIKFKGSIDMFNELIEKGAEFYPSIKAPSEVKQLFPDLRTKNLIEPKTKLLSEGGKENNEIED